MNFWQNRLAPLRIALVGFSFVLCLAACSDSNVDSGARADDSGANASDSSASGAASVELLNAYTALVADSINFTESDCCETLLSSAEILQTVDASRAKLVFRDDSQEKLILAEFSKDDSAPIKFFDLNNGIDAYHPDISPDGEWVAFGTTFEGWYHRSTLYVQNLRTGRLLSLGNQPGVVPRWRVLGQDTVIFFMDNGTLNVYEDWSEYGNYYVRFSDGKFSEPQKIFGNGSFTAVSDDFKYAVSVGPYFIARKMILVDGEETYEDSVWYNEEQICNVSMARDSSLRVSFLDLVGSEGVAYVGEKYVAHAKLFVVDTLGKIIQAVQAPENTVFDHTEWISEGEFEIATLENLKKDLVHDRIVLVNMKTELVTEIVSGEELWHPAFWVKK